MKFESRRYVCTLCAVNVLVVRKINRQYTMQHTTIVQWYWQELNISGLAFALALSA